MNGTAFLVKKWSGNNRSCFQTTNKIINSSAYAQSEAESIQIVLKAKNQLRFFPRYAALTLSSASSSVPVPERVRVPVSNT